MASQVLSTIENNFTKGLVTEFTGLNFPENAATDCDNCEFTLVGDILRRKGINYEPGYSAQVTTRSNSAISSYKWNNAGGDGETQVVVVQMGNTLYFYLASAATDSSPLSNHYIPATNVAVAGFTAAGGTFDASKECQYADGNGYLFVYHPSCDPFYCTYVSGLVTGNVINLQVRDFAGTVDNLGVNVRPQVLTQSHEYNLLNQGWVLGNPWQAASTTTNQVNVALQSYTVAAGLPVNAGNSVSIVYEGPRVFVPSVNAYISPGQVVASGAVTAYSSTTLNINVTSVGPVGMIGSNWLIIPQSTGNLDVWLQAAGNYPSNSDVWWYYKDNTDVFNPSVTLSNVTVSSGTAPSGHFIYNPFNQNRSLTTGLAVTNITTTARPTNGAWFQGRVWYTGVNGSQPAVADAPYTTWTESIYFSQVVQNVSDIGNCYQVNDPTSENLFNLLPTDGGVIVIAGCGNIYKLFPMQNALLVFAANGVWYITGSSGIGFTANDYTIVKLSSVRCISSTSFVDVNGLPYFWNEEGIYSVESAKQGTSLLNSPLHVNPLEVIPVTVGTILTFFNNIPTVSKQYARGVYDPIEYVIQWVYKDTEETSVDDRYQYNKILNFNTYNKAFFPYTISNSFPFNTSCINSIIYVASPGGPNAPEATIKYLATNELGAIFAFTFAEEYDTSYTDWAVGGGVNYVSHFTTGYKLHGQGQRRFQIPYLYVFSKLDGELSSYYVQSIWDYANSGNSGRWSTNQYIAINKPNYDMWTNRVRLRGQGLVLQLKFTSVDGQPFDIMGWSAFETQNTGV